MQDHNKKTVTIDEEDIINLKNAKERIIKTLYVDHYDALEVFTIQSIIDQYER